MLIKKTSPFLKTTTTIKKQQPKKLLYRGLWKEVICIIGMDFHVLFTLIVVMQMHAGAAL